MQSSLLHSSLVRYQILMERLRGLDFTSAKLTPRDLGLDEQQVYFAGPSGDRYTEQVFDDLNIGPADAVVDIGCAKGLALSQLAKYPFSRVDGIEISGVLAGIAQRNFERLGPTSGGCKVNIFCTNALDFKGYGNYNVFYLYCPFPADVQSQVLQLINTQNTAGRELIVVYNNPKSHDTMLPNGFHLHRRYPDLWGNGIHVYSNRRQSQRVGLAGHR